MKKLITTNFDNKVYTGYYKVKKGLIYVYYKDYCEIAQTSSVDCNKQLAGVILSDIIFHLSDNDR